jgi:hypothetical protein
LPARRAPAAPAPLSLRPVLFAWLFLSVVTQLPYLRAVLSPPPGRAFVGFFFFVDDSYNYLSFVEQAAGGRLLFENKLVLDRHAPALLNLEWLVAGWLSAVLGGSPLFAYRVLALGASFLLLWAVDYWLRRCALPASHRLPALMLVACGGGFGGFAFLARVLPPTDSLDLTSGLFPFLELLMSPHFTIATALVLWTLAAWLEGRTVPALLLGSALALTRPYDFILVVMVYAVTVVVTMPARGWLRQGLPLAGYLPVIAYNYWVFYRYLPFTTFHATNELIFPAWRSFAVALLPGLALAAAFFRGIPPGTPRPYWTVFLAWLAVATAMIVAPPVHFTLQFLVALGIPLLGLAALGLSRFSPRVMVGIALVMSNTAAVLTWTVMWHPSPHWFAPADAFAIARALGPACRPGDIAVTAGATGLYVGGLTSCRAFTSHANEPDHERRLEAVASFYGDAATPADRSLFLDRLCARFVLLPARSDAQALLGRAPRGVAAAFGQLVVYEWPLPAACSAAAD